MGAPFPRSATRRSPRAVSRRMFSLCYRATSVPGLLVPVMRCILLINSRLLELVVYFRLKWTFFGGYSSIFGEMKQTSMAFLAVQSLMAMSMCQAQPILFILQVGSCCSRMWRSINKGGELHHAYRSYE